MGAKQVAIACQGGGIHGAFTSGVLEAVLNEQERAHDASRKSDEHQFEICGLSGTSAGALNAFLVWYAMMLHRGRRHRFREARDALDRLWEAFSAQRRGERLINFTGQCLFDLSRFGVSVKHPMPPILYGWLMQALPQWSMLETVMSRHPLFSRLDVDLGEVRRTFYDFQALLKFSAPEIEQVFAEADKIADEGWKPRLLVGAVDILSGRFEAFDSFGTKGKQKRISLDAIEASGTLPEIHRAQRVGGAKDEDDGSLYWDGLFSQNPPIREFLTGIRSAQDKPNEIWVIRINPQRIPKEPLFLSSIEDRRNELAGNLSLNQELDFIGEVNDWIADKKLTTDGKYQQINVYVITMSERTSQHLGVDSKFDRSPRFIEDLRTEGKLRGERFLQLWKHSPDQLRQWRTPGEQTVERYDAMAV